jgi:hypothetical protein
LSFFHDYLRSAIWREYLDEENELDAVRTRLAEPALRWREGNAFGATLRAYGFENGIRHLIDSGRVDDAAGLLLDIDYRQAAARALHQARPVLDDVQRVRQAESQQRSFDVGRASELTVIALKGRQQLTTHLREMLDRMAGEADWEAVVSLASIESDESMRLLLACRAITHRNGNIPDDIRVQLQTILSAWANASGKPEWEKVLSQLLRGTLTEV